MKNLNHWFDKGMSGKSYIDSMAYNKEGLLSILGTFSLSEEDQSYFESLSGKGLRGIVLTADWCGDAMLCVPIMIRIAEAAGIELRYLIRDDNLELMDQYLTNGKSRSIPIMIFFDEKGEEKVVWGPRAPEVQQLVKELQVDLPPKKSPDFPEKQKEMIRKFKKTILSDSRYREAVSRSIKQRFQERLG